MLLMGIIEFGRAYNTQISIQAAAREGARELALRKSSADVDARGPCRRSVGHHRFDLADAVPARRATARRRSSSPRTSPSAFPFVPSLGTKTPHGDRSHAMRSLTRNHDDDRGAVLVWVALMLVVLLGIGALVIDVGALYAERRQLQNGADAAALAVAADCAEGDCLN